MQYITSIFDLVRHTPLPRGVCIGMCDLQENNYSSDWC